MSSSQVTRSGSTMRRRVKAPRAASSPPAAGGIDIREGMLPVGLPVEVRSRFDDRWTHGFSVAVVGEHGYQLRRSSDGSVLPAWFPPSMVRVDPAA